MMGSASLLRLANGPVNALSIANGFVAEIRSAFEAAESYTGPSAIISDDLGDI